MKKRSHVKNKKIAKSQTPEKEIVALMSKDTLYGVVNTSMDEFLDGIVSRNPDAVHKSARRLGDALDEAYSELIYLQSLFDKVVPDDFYGNIDKRIYSRAISDGITQYEVSLDKIKKEYAAYDEKIANSLSFEDAVNLASSIVFQSFRNIIIEESKNKSGHEKIIEKIKEGEVFSPMPDNPRLAYWGTLSLNLNPNERTSHELIQKMRHLARKIATDSGKVEGSRLNPIALAGAFITFESSILGHQARLAQKNVSYLS